MRNYLARLDGKDEKWGFNRNFLPIEVNTEWKVDHINWSNLKDGFYELATGYGNKYRNYYKVESGKSVEIEKSDIEFPKIEVTTDDIVKILSLNFKDGEWNSWNEFREFMNIQIPNLNNEKFSDFLKHIGGTWVFRVYFSENTFCRIYVRNLNEFKNIEEQIKKSAIYKIENKFFVPELISDGINKIHGGIS